MGEGERITGRKGKSGNTVCLECRTGMGRERKIEIEVTGKEYEKKEKV